MYNQYEKNKLLMIPSDSKQQIIAIFKKWNEILKKVEIYWHEKRMEDMSKNILKLMDGLTRLSLILNSKEWNNYISAVLISLNKFSCTGNLNTLKNIQDSFQSFISIEM